MGSGFKGGGVGGVRGRQKWNLKLFSVHLHFCYAAALFEFVLLDGNNDLVYANQTGYSANIALQNLSSKLPSLYSIFKLYLKYGSDDISYQSA